MLFYVYIYTHIHNHYETTLVIVKGLVQYDIVLQIHSQDIYVE
jgi:hypothetical protein